MQRIICLFIALLCGSLLADETDRRQVRSLTDRGLFDAAESFCNEKFAQPNIAETDKILLASELARSYSLHLPLLEPAQRQRILRRLETLEQNWLSAPSASADADLVFAKIILRLQTAMAYQSLGEYQRLEADTASITTRQAAYLLACSTLHDALERLKQAHQELHAFRQRVGVNTDAALLQRIQALDNTITMQQGITQKTLALTFQSAEDRNFELRQAAATFSGLAVRDSTEPIIVQCKIEKAACHRLAGELEQASAILNQLRSQYPTLTPTCQLRLDAESIRAMIASGNIAELRRQPHYAAGRPNVHLYPDFDLARLELFLASDPARNVRAESADAMRLEQSVDRQFGPHWARRVRLLVLASGNTELNSAEMLQSHGDTHYREGRFAEAANFYEQAALQADANRQAENMFRYNRLAAHAWMKALEQLPNDEPTNTDQKIVLQKRTITLLRKLIQQEPNHHDSQEFHALALNFQGQITVLQPETLDDYLTLLEEHAERWGNSPQLPNARRLAVILLERQGRLAEASAMLPMLDLEQLQTLPPEIQRLRARQLDAEGDTQTAVNMLTALLNQQRTPATLQLFAEILTRRDDASSLNHALQFWRELKPHTERGTETWWIVSEGLLVVLVKLNRREEAQQSYNMLRLLHPGLGGAERKGRLETLFSNAQ